LPFSSRKKLWRVQEISHVLCVFCLLNQIVNLFFNRTPLRRTLLSASRRNTLFHLGLPLLLKNYLILRDGYSLSTFPRISLISCGRYGSAASLIASGTP